MKSERLHHSVQAVIDRLIEITAEEIDVLTVSFVIGRVVGICLFVAKFRKVQSPV
jgi:hypothetical protein